MKMELTEGSETSAYINRTPGNYPKGNLLNTQVATGRNFAIVVHLSQEE